MMDWIRDATSPALILGNGINLYTRRGPSRTWDDLLLRLWKNQTGQERRALPEGLSLTEFYDLLEIKNDNASLQSAFCRGMEEWTPTPAHEAMVRWAQRFGVPVLTTNFDLNLSRSIGLETMRHLDSRGFTYFYPWKSCFSPEPVTDPASEFGIWHINGLINYPKSIRLGLSHYMGSVQRARAAIQGSSGTSLYARGDGSRWTGFDSWLHAVFHCDLIIVGLGLKENEVFLRWLLIERARYFRRFPDRRRRAHYLYSGDALPRGQEFFFEAIGLESHRFAEYRDLYEGLPAVDLGKTGAS